MNAFIDRDNKICAYLYNNKILLPSGSEVAGVVLGDCVFGYAGDIKGKIFNGRFYAVNGQIVAGLEQGTVLPEVDLLQVLLQGWHIVQKIKEHECPWIDPTEKWIPISVDDFLKQNARATVIKRASQKVHGKLL